MQVILLPCELDSNAMGRPSIKPRTGLGQHFLAMREAAGLTQQQLAQRIGVEQSTIAFWERGAKVPRSDVLPKLATALGVTIETLLGVSKPKPRQPVAKGRLQQLFEAASHLPRRQQRKIIDMVEPFVEKHVTDHRKAA